MTRHPLFWVRQGSLGRLSFEGLVGFGEGDPRLFAARPDMPGRLQPRRIVERPGADADHTAARQAIDPTRTIRAHEPSVKPTTIGHALKGSWLTGGDAEGCLR